MGHLHSLWNVRYGLLAVRCFLLLYVLNVKINTSNRIENRKSTYRTTTCTGVAAFSYFQPVPMFLLIVTLTKLIPGPSGSISGGEVGA